MTRHHPATPPRMPHGSGAHHVDRMLDQTRNDPYQVNRKYAEPTACPDCGLVFRHGRWLRVTDLPGSHADKHRCPACRRIGEKQPAGYVTIDGVFALAHRAEILALARHEAEREGLEHPLHRVMETQDAEAIVITTTDVYLPRRIGRALKNAYDGKLEIQTARDEYLVRVHWSR